MSTRHRWATNIDDLVLTVGWHGPVIIGVDWRDSMYEPDERGLLDIGGRHIGGHAPSCAACASSRASSIGRCSGSATRGDTNGDQR